MQLKQKQKYLTIWLINTYIIVIIVYIVITPQLAAENLLPFLFRGMLGEEQRKTLFYTVDLLRQLCAEKHRKRELLQLNAKAAIAVSLVERDFPVYIMVG
jgi:hypothetical protein